MPVHARVPVPVAVKRALDELRKCNNIDDPVCRGIPTRLSNYGGASVAPLDRLFHELSPAGQLLAVIALRNIEHMASTRMLIGLALKSNFSVRTLALASLGDRVGRRVDTALIDAMDDDSVMIRTAAAEALGAHPAKRNLKKVVPALLSHTADAEAMVQIAAIDSLGVLGDERAVLPLVEILDKSSGATRRAALFALRMLGDQRAVSAVIEVLRDEKMEVVREASKTLQRITGQSFGIDYELWKGWWEAQNE